LPPNPNKGRACCDLLISWSSPSRRKSPAPVTDCHPTNGIPGFTTTDTRVIKDLAGNEIRRDTPHRQVPIYAAMPSWWALLQRPRDVMPVASSVLVGVARRVK
jgi:hypothetical protein